MKPVGGQEFEVQWTLDLVLAAGQIFMAREGRVPRSAECNAAFDLPAYNTILRLFGSVRGFQAALKALAPLPSRQVKPVPQRACLKCGHIGPTWVCKGCKKTEDWQEAGRATWMTGTAAASWEDY